MITAVNKKFNLITSPLSGGKTITLLNMANKSLDDKGIVVIVTLDNNVTLIKKSIHCLYNDANLISIKHESDDKTPIGLELPNNLSIIDGVYDIESIQANIRELTLGDKPSIILIDTINFITNFSDKSYKEKMESIFLELDGMAQRFDCPVVGTMTVLGVSDFKEDFYKLSDTNCFKINRISETKYEVVDLHSKKKSLYSYSFKDNRLQEVDQEAYQEIYD